MDQKPHPINLEQVMFVRSIVVAMQGHEFTNDSINTGPDNNLVVTKLDNGVKRYQANMRTLFNQSNDASYPYSIDMECVGFFTVDDTLTEEEAMRGVTITAHNVLYGAIREAIAWITGRQPYGPLVFGLSVLRPTQPVAVASE